MGRPASSRNLILSTNARYAYEFSAIHAASVQPRGAAGANFAITLAMMVGLLDVACVVVAASGNLLVAGNDLARTAIERNGPGIIASYRWTTLVVGLMLVMLGVRAAASRVDKMTPTRRAYLKAALSGLNAAGIALLAWWTGWLFV